MTERPAYLKLVPPAPRPEVKSFIVRISVRRDRGLPGRSREIRFSETQFRELAAAIERIEARL